MLLPFVNSFNITHQPIDSTEIQSSIKLEAFDRVQIGLSVGIERLDFLKRIIDFTNFYIKLNHLVVLDVLLLSDSINIFHYISHLLNNVFLMHLVYFKKSVMESAHFSFHFSVGFVQSCLQFGVRHFWEVLTEDIL